MDRENIGGNMSGQQSNYVSRGGNPTNNKWSLDGVDITDMSATGSSPTYYDFDMFEEMTINTGGVDVTQQTGGVGINLVTKSGSDRFPAVRRRFYRHQRQVRIEQHHRRISARRAHRPATRSRTSRTTASRSAGRSRRAAPGSGARSASNVIDVGVLGFYQPTATCQAIKSDSASSRFALGRRRQRLPEHRRDAAADDEPQGRSAAVQGQQAERLQPVLEEGAQRARRRAT